MPRRGRAGAATVRLAALTVLARTCAALQWVKDDGQDGWVSLWGLGTRFKIIEPGSGPAVSLGARVTVHGVGVVTESGRLFWSTRTRFQEPFSFTVGAGEVVTGWDKGIVGARLGEKRQLEVPPAEAFGAEGSDRWRIPPNAALVLELQVLRLEGGEAGVTAEVPGLLKEYERELR